MGITVKSGATGDEATVDVTSKAIRATLYDPDGNEIMGRSKDRFIVTGGTSAVVAASLAAPTTLMSLRNGATKSVYITRLRCHVSVATVGTSALVAGSIGWQRFSTATPSGGTARTVAKKATAYAATTVADVRDSNAALTVTSVVFGDVLSITQVPIMTVGGDPMDWTIDMHDDPVVLAVNEGICLRTQVAMPLTQTWMFSYMLHWYER